jgi:hypothetical protein
MAEKNKSFDDQIKEAELQRIKAETSRIESEKNRIVEEKLKIKEERKELERKNNLPWRRRPALFQALTVVILAVPLIWFYMGDMVIPSYNIDNIKLAWKNEVGVDSVRRAKKQHQNEARGQKVSNPESQVAPQEQKTATLQALIPTNRKKPETQVARQEQKTASLQGEKSLYLSGADAASMIKQKGYYDEYKNPGGKGIAHQYEAKTLSADKVVFDHATGWMWQQSGSADFMYYQDAKKYINRLNREQFAGFTGWRLPTLEEAMSLMESEKKNGDLYINPVFDPKQGWIWTTDHYSASHAWGVFFDSGGCYDGDIAVFNIYVRAVRSPGEQAPKGQVPGGQTPKGQAAGR